LLYFLEAFSAISFAISSFVLPSVLMPSSFAATINESDVDCVVVEALGAETSLDAFSNSFRAKPIDRVFGCFLEFFPGQTY